MPPCRIARRARSDAYARPLSCGLPRSRLGLRALTRYNVLGIASGRSRLFEFLIVLRARLGIGQNRVRLVYIRKFFGRGAVAGIDVGMIPLCKHAITALDLLVSRCGFDI